MLPPAQRTLFLEKLASKGMSLSHLPIPAVRQAFEQVPLSYAQQRQWFLWQLDPQSTAYHIPVALRIRGALDRVALQRSLDALLERHESLRSAVQDNPQQPRQVLVPEARVLLEQHPAQPAPGVGEAALIQAFVVEQSQRLFDLGRVPLLRVSLLQLAEQDQVLVLTLHHIVADGWSMQVLVDELLQLYGAFSQGQVANLPALPIQYADYAIWQRHWMEAGERERQLAYWLQQLGGEQPVLELPLDRARPEQPSFRGARLQLELPAGLAQGLKQLAQQQQVTLFVALLASFQVLLQRHSGQRDIRVGVPVANRNRAETAGLIGFFVNTQVLAAQVDGQATFSQLLQQVKATAVGAQAHQDLPFEQLVEALHPERSLGVNPLFQVLFNHQGSAARGQPSSLQLPGLSLEQLDWDDCTAQFDLTLDTGEWEEGISASFTYATDLFDAATVERLAAHWLNLLQAVVANPEQRIAELPMQTAAEQAASLAEWNADSRDFPAQACLHQLIETQAARVPDATAVVFQDQRLSYAELNSQANQLAHYLIAQGAGPEVRVGLAVERGLPMVVAIVAILKAGGAYVPLDPIYPQERLGFMVEDSGIAVLLTQASLQERFPGVPALLLDTPLDGYPQHNPEQHVVPGNLAYIIYTSGSTGKPKGALLAHHNVVRLFEATESWFGFDQSDVWSLFHSYAFDFSVWEIFGALLYGGKLVVVPQDVARSPEDFLRLLGREGVTVLNQTPSAFKALMHEALSAENPQLSLRHVVFGGEALDVKSLRPWFERFGDNAPRLINMYGITETTVHVTYRPLSLADLELEASSPIGAPIPDLSWYVLDADLNLVAKGCTGELYVGRAGLARGYLNRGDLTATRFIPDLFGNTGERLYRTGDLARYHADGVIEYIGRIDQQVKIRGFRIELGEIEARLLEQPEVASAVVLAHNGPLGTQLVGYVVPKGAVEDGLREVLRARLKETLPDYMVPAHLLQLDALPLTANGKLDRKALPAPDASQAQQAYVAPRSELEQRIAAIWQDVLQVERVGLDDDFFALGGHSLLATQVITRVREQLQREVPLKTLFLDSVLGAFCAGVEAQQAETCVHDELAKSLQALKRLTGEELDKLIT
ncbi:amino acid adenylation domain-containing protein [Pseudomonas sichuanensis]